MYIQIYANENDNHFSVLQVLLVPAQLNISTAQKLIAYHGISESHAGPPRWGHKRPPTGSTPPDPPIEEQLVTAV